MVAKMFLSAMRYFSYLLFISLFTNFTFSQTQERKPTGWPPLYHIAPTATFYPLPKSTNSDYLKNSNAAQLDSTTFTSIDFPFPGVMAGNAVWFDYDSDNDLDIIVSGLTDSKEFLTKIYRNDDRNFIDIEAPLIPLWTERGVAWGDYDNDGDFDLAIQGRVDTTGLENVTKIYRNDDRNFIDINASLIGLSGGSVIWADFDNDGLLDLLISGSPDNGSTFYSKIYKNEKDNFVDINADLPGVWGSSIAAADYDNDGDSDILLTGYGDYSTTSRLYRNDLIDGTINLVETDVSLTDVNSSAVAWGDYNNDGYLDIALSGVSHGEPITKIYRNNSGNSFTNINAPLKPMSTSAIAWGDYDNDGDLDLAVSGCEDWWYATNPTTKIYRNDNGTFVDLNADITGTWFGSLEWGDYDKDGKLDLLITGGTVGRPQFHYLGPFYPVTKIYKNNTNSLNTPPDIPKNLSVDVVSGKLKLKWDASNDSQTPGKALTYNLRIGKTPGGHDVVSPVSNVVSGYRRAPKFGNQTFVKNRVVKRLPPGTYYWSVQSVDNGYAGSTFAPEKTFIVLPPAVIEDTSKFFSFLPDSIVALKDGKIPKAMKRKPIASYWEFTLIYTGTEPVAELNIQFKADVNFVRGIENNKFETVTELTKKKFKFTNGLVNPGDTVIVSGFCIKPKHQQIKKYWFGGTAPTPNPAINLEPTSLSMEFAAPNYTNMIDEIFSEGGFEDTRGLLVGKILTQKNTGGWVRMKKSKDVLISLRDETGLHTAGPSYFDYLNNGAKRFVKEQKTLPPSKHNNKLFAEVVALKLGIVASALEKTPFGFGYLKYYNPEDTVLHDKNLSQIALMADAALTNKVGNVQNFYTVIRSINLAFSGPIQPESFASRTVFKGSKSLAEVPFLRPGTTTNVTRIIPEIQNHQDIPSEFQLSQNYPNPFNPSTTIEFSLPEDAVVTLIVYNLLGQEVATLLDREELYEGEHSIDFSADNLSSGVYFYRIIVDNGRYQAFKKMLLLR